MNKNQDQNSPSIPSGHPSQTEPALPDTNPSRQIGNPRQLRRAISKGRYEFRLLLIGGAYSRKHVTTDDRGRFCVFNYIDDSVQKLTGRELYTKSNIGAAMDNGAFIVEGQDHE